MNEIISNDSSMSNFNIVFTSNRNPAQWREDFSEDDTLLCALDRIFDDATVFNIKGESHRGQKLEKIQLNAQTDSYIGYNQGQTVM